MPRQPSCEFCRWFSLMRDGALIGRCRNEVGDHAFPRKAACCPQFDVERRTELRDAADGDTPAIEFERPTRRF